MAEILGRSKPLAVSPLKTSQPLGASLAVLGLNRAMPLLHGAQGCTAFAKVFLVRHFREPIPLQSTAMDPVSSIMGADDNLHRGAENHRREKPAGGHRPADHRLVGSARHRHSPRAQGLPRPTSRISERADRAGQHPGFQRLSGKRLRGGGGGHDRRMGSVGRRCRHLSGPSPASGQRVVRLVADARRPGSLRELIERFGLHPVLIPDLSDSLDGHLDAEDFSPVTIGGTPLSAFATLGDAAATLVIGPSLYPAAELLERPDRRAGASLRPSAGTGRERPAW